MIKGLLLWESWPTCFNGPNEVRTDAAEDTSAAVFKSSSRINETKSRKKTALMCAEHKSISPNGCLLYSFHEQRNNFVFFLNELAI